MLMRWGILLDIFVEILWLYVVMAFGRPVKADNDFQRAYKFRGRVYLI